MRYRLVITELAEIQAEDYEAYYESRLIGLGDRFIDHLFDTYQRIEDNPKSWQKL